MATPNAHATVTASGYERWSHCTAAPRYEEHFPGTSSVYADEGTLAHRACELYGRKKFTVMSVRKFNAELKKLKVDPLWQDEMVKTAEFYVDFLTEKANACETVPHVAFEVRVDLTDYIPDGFGTCDCIMIGGDTLRITDYKHGKGVKVSASNNGQMRLYALGALKYFSPIYGDTIKRVCTAIVQPRISEDVEEEWLSVEELRAWGETEARPKAQAAYFGLGTFCAGEWCRFCKGKAQCAARAAFFTGFEDFKNLTPANGSREIGKNPCLSDAEVGDLLIRAEGLVQWYKDLQNYATSAMLDGSEIPGWKLVEGRSNRAFTDVDTAVQKLIDAGYDEALIYDRKPKTLSELEKMLGKKTFSELLSECVTKPKGKATLALASDRREAYCVGAAEFAGASDG